MHDEGHREEHGEEHDEAHDEEHNAGDHIVLRASAMRWVWVLIGSMVFVTLGVGMALGAETGVGGKVIGWLIALPFGFCAIVGLRQIVQPGSLAVGRTTIDMIRRGRLTTFELAACGRFSVWRNPSRGSSFVVFDYTLDGDTELHRANRQLMGGSRLLTDNYGMSADDLATLLNDVRNRFVSDSSAG